jgi:hypothetical protein
LDEGPLVKDLHLLAICANRAEMPFLLKKGYEEMKTTLYKIFAGLAPALVMMGLLTSAALGAPFMEPDATLQDHIVVFSSERVDAPKWFHWMNSHSLRIDSTTNRNPHIVYGGDHLYYASYTGSAWQVETVDSAYGVGKYASLALDSNNRPHISYYDSVNGALKYATHNGTSWQITTIERTFYTAASEACTSKPGPGSRGNASGC